MAKGIKTGGRQKGSLNKRQPIVAEILATLQGGDGKMGFDIVKEYVECYHRCANTDGIMHLAVKCLDGLMPYVHAKKNPDSGMSPEDIEMIQQIKQLASRPKQEIIDVTKAELKKIE